MRNPRKTAICTRLSYIRLSSRVLERLKLLQTIYLLYEKDTECFSVRHVVNRSIWRAFCPTLDTKFIPWLSIYESLAWSSIDKQFPLLLESVGFKLLIQCKQLVWKRDSLFIWLNSYSNSAAIDKTVEVSHVGLAVRCREETDFLPGSAWHEHAFGEATPFLVNKMRLHDIGIYTEWSVADCCEYVLIPFPGMFYFESGSLRFIYQFISDRREGRLIGNLHENPD